MTEAARVTAEFSGIADEAEGSDWRVRLHDPVARIYLDGRLAAENTRFPFSPEDVRARAGRIGAGLSGPGFIGLGYNPIGAIIGLVGATAAVLCWWFALRGHVAESRKRMGFSGLGGIIFAVVGFTGGIAVSHQMRTKGRCWVSSSPARSGLLPGRLADGFMPAFARAGHPFRLSREVSIHLEIYT